MGTVNPYQTYQQNSVMTASPQDLTLMLYNGCLKFIKLAKRAMADGNVQEKHTNLVKAQAIIRELQVTLNTDSEVGGGMASLYDFVYSRLIDGNIKNELPLVEEAEAIVTELRDTWKQAMQSLKQA